MLLALDVGNTDVTCGLVEDGSLVETRRVPSSRAITEEDAERVLVELAGARHPASRRAASHLAAGDPPDLRVVDAVVLGSVVPAWVVALREVTARHGIPLLVADASTIPIPVDVPDPSGVGADRLLNAYAALRRFGAPAIVVDLGTATTFEVVDRRGAYVGGAIAPGLRLGLDALGAGTAQLPRVELRLPAVAIGRDTPSAIQSGAVIGHLGLVRELLARLRLELGEEAGTAPTTIATGGLSALEGFGEALPVDVVDPSLTLTGLVLLHAEVGATGHAPHAVGAGGTAGSGVLAT